MSVTLTYTISQSDFMDAAQDLWRHEGLGDRGNWIAAVVALGVGAALFAYGFWVAWIWIGLSAFLIAITLLRRVLWRRGYVKMVKYTAPITATFAPDQIETTSAEGQSKLEWSTFTKYAETNDHFFIFLDRRSFSILQKSAIATSEDLDGLRNMFDANLIKKKRRWF